MANELAALSDELAAVVARSQRSVAAVHARPRFSSSGVFWRPGVIVTAEHTIRREEEITVTLPDGKNAPATLARIAGLGIPASTIDRVVDEILAKGRVARGYLGVGLQPVELTDHQKGL